MKFYPREDDDLEAELSAIKSKKGKKKWWKGVIKEFDHIDALNDQRHLRNEYRDFFDITSLDRGYSDNMETHINPKILNVCIDDDWLDIIYSENPQDLQELIEEEKLYNAVKALKPNYKEVLMQRDIWGWQGSYIAEKKGVTDRAVRKLYCKAKEKLIENLDKM